jgi:hypothetical protein
MPQLLPSNRWDSSYCAAWKRKSQRHYISIMFRIIIARSVCLGFFVQQMESNQRVIIRFLCKERVSLEDIHTLSWSSSLSERTYGLHTLCQISKGVTTSGTRGCIFDGSGINLCSWDEIYELQRACHQLISKWCGRVVHDCRAGRFKMMTIILIWAFQPSPRD